MNFVFTQYYNSNEHICCHVLFAKKLNVHSDNTLVNCNAIFCGCKNGDFQMKKIDGGCSNKCYITGCSIVLNNMFTMFP